jgi:hypothetical protein
MCIAEMVEKIVNDWTDADFADADAAGARECHRLNAISLLTGRFSSGPPRTTYMK